MKSYYSLIVLLTFALYSCAPSVKVSRLTEHPPLAANERVTVFYLNDKVPDGAEIIGSVNIDNNGLTINCTYKAVIASASDQARAMGANAIKITEHRRPDPANSCHRIAAFAYYISPEVLAAKESTDKIAGNTYNPEALEIIEFDEPVETPETAGTIVKETDNSRIVITGAESSSAADSAANSARQQIVTLNPETGRYNVFEGEVQSAAPQRSPDIHYLDNRVRLSIDMGFTYRLGKPDDALAASMIGRRGITYGAELLFFDRESFGWGPKYTGRTFSKYFNNELGIGTFRINMNYFGVSFMGREFDARHRNAFVMAVSGGYVHYSERLGDRNSKPVFTAGGFQMTYEIGYDIRMGRASFFGLKLALNYGAVYMSTPVQTIKSNVSSIDLTGGFRF